MELTSRSQEQVDEAEEIKNLKKIEAALFIAGRFLSLQELVAFTDINPILLRELIEKLQEEYNDNSAIEIITKDDNWKMDVKAEYKGMVNRLATGTAEFSKAEQETLAVIAYKQPVKQSIIVKIRGNKAYEHIRHFQEIGLVKGKRLGHTKELTLSEDFYDYFNLRNPEKISDGHRNSNEFRDLQKRNKEIKEIKEPRETESSGKKEAEK